MTKLETGQYQYLSQGVMFVFLLVAFIWLRSGIGKVWGGEFVGGFAKTAGYFASKNPYPVVQDFLQSVVIPNSAIFATVTMWGEILCGVAIAGSILYMLLTRSITTGVLLVLLIGLFAGGVLNGVFYLVAGWTSPSTESVNLLMAGIQIVGIIVSIQLLKTCK